MDVSLCLGNARSPIRSQIQFCDHAEMSALGQKQTFAPQKVMSALPPKADICSALARVRFVPIADSCSAAKRILFDHFVGASHKLRRRHGEAERLPFKKDVLAPGFSTRVRARGSH